MKFEDLKFIARDHFGIRAHVQFPNGYGASIIQGDFSYGGSQGLFELAVLKNGEITYETEITDDVIGYLTPEEVTVLLQRIESLPCANGVKKSYIVN